jgi:hypothetical protein
MLPKIKKVEFMNVHIDDDVHIDSDLFLFPHGVETVEASHRIKYGDLERMLLHDPDAVVFGVGFKKKLDVDKKIYDHVKKNCIEIHVLPTVEAARKFQQLARQGKKVAAKLHVTC